MKVNGALVQQVMIGIGSETEREGVGLEEGQRNLSRLLDDLAELSSELDARARHALQKEGVRQLDTWHIDGKGKK